MKQTLYHGSYLSVPAPLTGVGRRELDFGPGFYVTSLREQAERINIIATGKRDAIEILERELSFIEGRRVSEKDFLSCVIVPI